MSVTDGPVAARAVTVGVDWAQADHAVCVIDADGAPVERVTIKHARSGLARLREVLARYDVAGVGIERPDGPVVDTLLRSGVTVFVIPPAQMKNLRGRYGSAGNKDDRFDAFVLADTVRTDRRRLTPLQPDTAATTVLRTLVRARKDLVRHRVAVANQLRAHLQIALPGLVGLFTELDAPTSRAFIAEFATQDAVDALTAAQLTGWLRAHHAYRSNPQVLWQRLQTAARGPVGAAGQALASVTAAYLAALSVIAEQITVLETQLADALAAHPDQHIFTSLPPRRDGPRRPAPRRDRRRPGPVPDPGLPGRTGRGHPVHPPVGTGPHRRVPVGGQQRPPRRSLRLRRRLRQNQPLGRRPLPTGPPARLPPPTRRQNPRPRLARRHLEMLDHQHRLQPRPPQRPPNHPQPRSKRGGLTQDTPARHRSGLAALPARPAVPRPYSALSRM
jgi:transposase